MRALKSFKPIRPWNLRKARIYAINKSTNCGRTFLSGRIPSSERSTAIGLQLFFAPLILNYDFEQVRTGINAFARSS